MYLIDFEVAVDFSSEMTLEKRLCYELPFGGSFKDPAKYGRPLAPEMTQLPYCPFKLDVWQLGKSYANYRVRVITLYSRES